MKQNGNIYTAEDGKLIVRKSDGFIMGDAIDLGSADNIENYEENEFSQEEIDAFFESVGINHKNKEHEDQIN